MFVDNLAPKAALFCRRANFRTGPDDEILRAYTFAPAAATVHLVSVELEVSNMRDGAIRAVLKEGGQSVKDR